MKVDHERKFFKPAIILFILISICVTILVTIYDLTKDPIRVQQIAVEVAMVTSLLPGTVYTEEEYIEEDYVTKIVTGFNDQNEIIGYVVTAYSQGYAGIVEIMVGFDAAGALTNVSVLRHRETPGLGTAILEPNFLGQFAGRTEPMIVARMPTNDNEIQALASATISTAAVVNGVNTAMAFMAGVIDS